MGRSQNHLNMHPHTRHAGAKARAITQVCQRSLTSTSARHRHPTFGELLRSSSFATFDPLLPQVYITYGEHRDPAGTYPVGTPSQNVTLAQIKDTIPRDPKKAKKKTPGNWPIDATKWEDFGLKSPLPVRKGRDTEYEPIQNTKMTGIRVLSLDSKERFPWFVKATDRVQMAEAWTEMFGRIPVRRQFSDPGVQQAMNDTAFPELMYGGAQDTTFAEDAGATKDGSERADQAQMVALRQASPSMTAAYPNVSLQVHPPLYISTVKDAPASAPPETPVYGRVISRSSNGWRVGLSGMVAYLPDRLTSETTTSFISGDGGWYVNVRIFYVHGTGFDDKGRPSIILGTMPYKDVKTEHPQPWKEMDLATKQDWLISGALQAWKPKSSSM